MPTNTEVNRKSFKVVKKANDEVVKKVKDEVLNVRWTVENFTEAYSSARGGSLESNNFVLVNDNSFNIFSLTLRCPESDDADFSFYLLQYYKGMTFIEFECKAWLEDLDGNKYYESGVDNYHNFEDAAIRYYFAESLRKQDLGTIIKLKNDVAIFCCEAKQYMPDEEIILPEANLELCQKLWESYQGGRIDSIAIEVEDNGLETSKSILTANSDVFEPMLLTENCKKLQNGLVKIKKVKIKSYLNSATQKKQESSKSGYLDNTKKKKRKKPNLYINEDELTMNDIAQMCHSFVAKNESKQPAWMVFKRKFEQPGQMVFTRINCTEEQLNDESKQLAFVEEFFGGDWTSINEEVLNENVYWKKLTHIYIPKQEQLKRFFETRHDAIKELHRDGNTKLSLLTTIEEMVGFNYPLPGFDDDIFGVAPVVPTKDQYAKVTSESPIFVLDCEMCVTNIGQPELTRVTMIDESGQTILDTFVKPSNKITDYVTCFSGITENSLHHCFITLQDVQEAFRRILPPDAILCGYAIENDLRALRLSHPYCIDVGLAYNMIKKKKVRTSLRVLMYYFFNERIQSSDLGHCSYEDAWATLRLLKLKLENGKSFGSLKDWFDYIEWAKSQGFYGCVEHFQNATAKNVAKDSMRKVALPEPEEIGRCITCQVSITSQCFIDQCLCVQKMTEYCCICVGKEIMHGKLVEENRFNFEKAISCLQGISYCPTLQDMLKTYKKPPKVLIAKYLNKTENAKRMSDQNVHFYDMNSYGSLREIEKNLFDQKIASHDLCLLEYDAQSLQLSDIDSYLRALHRRIRSNGVFGVLMCSPQKAILYTNVKQ